MAREDISLLTQTADFLVKYGFLAVGLVLVFLIAPMVYKIWKANRITLATVCFGIAFIVAFGILDILQKNAPWLISSQRTMITGIVIGVREGHQLQMKSNVWRAGQAYTKRESEAEAQTKANYNFPFILLTPDKPDCLAVAIASNDPNSESISTFNVAPIVDDDMSSNLQILAQIVQDDDTTRLQVWRERNEHKVGESITFNPLSSTTEDCSAVQHKASFEWNLIAPSYAQTAENTSIGGTAARLQSDDVFVRRDARIELAKQGATAFTTIIHLLDDKDYRLQLGAVVALAGMDDDQRKQASPELLNKVRPLLGHPDKAMRDAALQAIKEPLFCYQEEDLNKVPEQRYLVLCHWSKSDCEVIRGPNRKAGVSQSDCVPVDLTKMKWNYSPGGVKGAWYQYSSSPFRSPFPQLHD